MTSTLVTGATSYLGTALVRRLCGAGRTVHALVRPSTDLGSLGDLVDQVAVHVHDGSTAGLVAIVEQAAPDVVFHLASSYRREHSPEDVETLVRANVEFGSRLLEAMRLGGGTRLVNTGSHFQWYEGGGALNLYAATKWAFSAILDYYADAHGLKPLTLVLFDVYGPGDPRAKLTSAIVEAVKTGGPLALPSSDPVLDLVYIDDTVSAFVRAAALLDADPDQVAGRHFAVSSGERRKLSEIVDVFEAVGGRQVQRSWGAFTAPERRIEVPWEGDPLPGWTPQVTLREGVTRLLGTGAGR